MNRMYICDSCTTISQYHIDYCLCLKKPSRQTPVLALPPTKQKHIHTSKAIVVPRELLGLEIVKLGLNLLSSEHAE